VAVDNHFTSDLLNKAKLPVLNRSRQAIKVRTLQDTFCPMATNAASALEIAHEADLGEIKTA
jgi:hypothetical protein